MRVAKPFDPLTIASDLRDRVMRQNAPIAYRVPASLLVFYDRSGRAIAYSATVWPSGNNPNAACRIDYILDTDTVITAMTLRAMVKQGTRLCEMLNARYASVSWRRFTIY